MSAIAQSAYLRDELDDHPPRFIASWRLMSIRREHRHFYRIDGPQLSAVIRFVRAKGCCEGCDRPHMQVRRSLWRWPLVGCGGPLLAKPQG